MSAREWLTPLLDATQMRQLDRWAIEECGVDGLELMERAGEAVASAVQRLAAEGLVVIVCGKGNNGGDGLVAARLLREASREVEVLMLVDGEQLGGDAKVNLERLQGRPPVPLFEHRADAAAGQPGEQEGRRRDEEGSEDVQLSASARAALSSAAVIVDALLGTGFSGVPSLAAARAIQAIEAAGAAVIAVDVPSGVDASTGIVKGAAVHAERTVTFDSHKRGLWINPGKRHSGISELVDIGIPRGGRRSRELGLIEPSVLSLLPSRGAASTKFTSGHVLVLGGSANLTGAPRLAGEAAMRAGAGYVTVCVPRSVQHVLASGSRPELMTRGLAERDGALDASAVGEALQASERGGCVVLGPGLSRERGAAAFARELGCRIPVAIVIDADGLNAYCGALEELASRSAPTVLTPHSGELGRLLGVDSEQVEQRRLQSAVDAAKASGAVVVLKGDDTLVAESSGTVAVSPGGSPALATAGTGDVLSGVIAAQLAAGLDAFTAACAGVMMHLLAGRLAAAAQGSAEGVIASDVIDALPRSRSLVNANLSGCCKEGERALRAGSANSADRAGRADCTDPPDGDRRM